MHSHDHSHPHGPTDAHDGHHHHPAERARPEHVVLDIGEGVGALVVRTDPGLLGREVEISPSGEDGKRSHKEVLERVTAGGSTHVLVFDDLAEGSYTLWLGGVAKVRGVDVRGGQVAELDWR